MDRDVLRRLGTLGLVWLCIVGLTAYTDSSFDYTLVVDYDPSEGGDVLAHSGSVGKHSTTGRGAAIYFALILGWLLLRLGLRLRVRRTAS